MLYKYSHTVGDLLILAFFDVIQDVLTQLLISLSLYVKWHKFNGIGGSVVPYRNAAVPIFVILATDEMKVALSIENVTALVLLVAANAMTVLTKHQIRARSRHRAANAQHSGGRIAAELLAAVIKHDHAPTLRLGGAHVL